MLEGIDVYEGQGYVDWGQVRSARKAFGFVKATEGNYHQDYRFPHNWESVLYRGMVRGCYHYFKPTIDPVEQCDFLHAYVRSNGRFISGDLVWLDCEELDGIAPDIVLDRIVAFVVYARASINKQVGIYTFPDFWLHQLGNPVHPELTACPLWLADYGSSVPTLNQWPNGLSFWQYSDTGTCPGIGVDCDLNRFYGSLADLYRLRRYP